MNNLFMIFMFVGTFFSAFSQLLLKQSASQKHTKKIYEYLNWRVITAYAIFFFVLMLNTYAYTKVPYKYGSVIDTFTYVFVLLFSWVILKEKISKEKLLGNFMIIVGIIIYTL